MATASQSSGGHRLNLDADEADEFVLCDRQQVTETSLRWSIDASSGALPEAADAVLSVEGTGMTQRTHRTHAESPTSTATGALIWCCRVPSACHAQAGFLGFTVHRGVETASLTADGQHLVWQIPALVNQDSVHFVLKTGPASIVACVASNCATPK